MGRYLFIGGTEGNTGPDNVNKGIVSNLPSNFFVISNGNKVKKYVNAFLYIVRCNIVIVSGVSKIGMYAMKLAKIFGKKTIYILHGCNEIEFKVNQMPSDEKALKYEKYFLNNSDLILAVSERYSKLIQKRYPVCVGRIDYLHNGVNKVNFDCNAVQREKGRIIAVGGDRKLKNNIVVANAVAKLDDSKKLMVYGHLYHPDDLPKVKNIEFKGLVSQKQLYEEMMKSELFVLNSVYESFALSVFDALLCGCSILITNVAGALELLNVTEYDVIYDPMNKDEIAEKIEYLLQHPNNERLMKNLNFDKISYEAEVKRLEQFCEMLCQKSRS